MIKVVETFGKYRLLERLAQGGMAEVFRAVVSDARGQVRVVAIKRLHRALCEDMDLAQMLVDEAGIAVQLNHPNIGEVFDLGQIDHQYFLIMEFIDGVDLQRVLDELGRRHRLMPLPLVVAVMAEICSGLHYAHSKNGSDGQPLGIVHRDVSPHNIMVSVRGEVKLVDFGIAKARMRAQQTRAGIIKGKYYYMAPEQAHGHHVDPRTDVFAAGMVLYQLATGQSAYEDVPERDLMRAVRMCEFPAPRAVRADLDPELAQIIERAIERSPERRWSNAMELQLALNDFHQRKLPRISRHDLVQFIADVTGPAGVYPGFADGGEDEAVAMARQAYQASGESLLFERPESLVYQLESSEFQIMESALLPEESPTALLDPAMLADARRAAAEEGEAELRRAAHPVPVQGSGAPAGMGPAEPAWREEATQTAGRVPRRPLAVYGGLAAVTAIIIAGASAIFVLGDAAQEAAPVAEQQVAAPAIEEAPLPVLALNTEPTNATVLLDGETRGSTPLSLRLESGRSYQLELRKPGFQPVVETIAADTAGPEKTVALQKARGILKVASFPPDAVVTIDGTTVGETPVTQIGMAMDEPHEIVATLDGKTLTRTVSWDDRSDNVQEVMFEFLTAEAGQVAHELGGLVELDAAAPEAEPEAQAAPTKANKTVKKAPPKRKPKKKAPTRSQPPKRKAKSEESSEGFDIWGEPSGAKEDAKKGAKDKEKASDAEGLDLW